MKLILRFILLYLFITLYSKSSFAQCTLLNPSPKPNASDQGSGPGLVAWTSPSNSEVSDNSMTTASSKISAASTQLTHYIYARSFGFALPSSAVICGIQVTVEHLQQGAVSGAFVKDYSIQLINGAGSINGSNFASAASWPTTKQSVVYGADTNLWGASWSAADINSNNFGVMITAQLTAGSTMVNLSAQIDYITIAVAYYDGALPIALLDFSAKTNKSTVDLNWITASETNTNNFALERSKDATSFEQVYTVKAAGNSTRLLPYKWTDEQPFSGTSYYRLKEVDNNGKYEYFPLASVFIEGTKGFSKVYPLKNNILTVQLEIPEETEVEIAVLNLTGEKIQAILQSMPKGFSNVNINMEKLASGIYFIEAKLPGEDFYSKVYVVKE